ncbi:MAG TPA: phosphatase PAP2 family protein [Mycobacterium sp.]|nr:phosphatase PAP2 family protein [Mycobacterium sp.]
MKWWTWVLVALSAIVYAVLWIGWLLDWAWLASFDTWCLDAFGRIVKGSPAWQSAWEWYCTVFGPTAFRIYGVFFIIWLLFKRYWRAALFLVLTIELSAVLTEVAKWLAGRPRPATAMVYAEGTSFPSGHALGLMVIVLAAVTLLWPIANELWRAVLVVVGAVLVISIGVSRVVLNVHNPSDVLAGWALGYLYFVLCCALVRPAGTQAVLGRAP